METLPKRLGLTAHSKSVAGIGVALMLCASSAGCTVLGPFTVAKDETPKASSACCQAVATWLNRVHYEPDPTNGGVLTPGIVGRLYLLDSSVKYPQVGDGSILVSLYDDSGPAPSEKPIEIWYIDADTLRRLLRQDTIGWGYTLFLPWSSYKREISRVHLTVRYDPKHGSPLYTPSSALTLEHPSTPARQPGPEVPPGAPPIGAAAPPVPPVQR